MVHLTRINHTQVVLNSDLIEHIEATPDTVISLTNGEKIMVLESSEEIVRRVMEFQRYIHSPGAERLTGQGEGGTRGKT